MKSRFRHIASQLKEAFRNISLYRKLLSFSLAAVGLTYCAVFLIGKWLLRVEQAAGHWTEAQASQAELYLGLGLLAAWVTAAVVLSVAFRKSLFGPLAQLIEGARKLGQGRLSEKIQLNGSDEIGKAATAFNDLAGKLEGRDLEMRRLAIGLEKRVAERTADLSQEIDLHEQVEQDLRKNLSHLELHNRLITAAATSTDPDQILQALCAELAGALDAPQAAFSILNEERSALRVAAEYRAVEPEGEISGGLIDHVIPLEESGPVRAALERMKPVFVPDARLGSQGEFHKYLSERGAGSALVVPLIVRGRAVGALEFDSLDHRKYSVEEIDLAQSTTNAVGQALENARLYKELQQELSERKRVEERLRYDALHDSLTGLPNRAYFIDQVRRAIDRARRRKNLAALIFMDLDRFKVINDSLGHPAGDKMLSSISRRIEAAIRPGDIVARFGGDEFAVLLEDIKSVEDATGVAERIQRALSAPVTLEGHVFSMTASMGIAYAAGDYKAADDMLRDADIAMYRAKANGKARYEVFASEMHRTTLENLQLEADLRNALAGNELTMQYIPIFSLQKRQVAAVEAVPAWDHPTQGLLLAQDFLKTAEDSGLACPLCEWTLTTVCRQLKAWRDQGLTELAVGVGMTKARFQDAGAANYYLKFMEQEGLPPKFLMVHVREQLILQNLELAKRVLPQLHSAGLKIVIDDFGSHYSLIPALLGFPVDLVKIDAKFTRNVMTNEGDAVITTALIRMVQGQKVAAAAKGVDTVEQVEFLTARNCNLVQGRLISGPLEPGAMTSLLLNGASLPVNLRRP